MDTRVLAEIPQKKGLYSPFLISHSNHLLELNCWRTKASSVNKTPGNIERNVHPLFPFFSLFIVYGPETANVLQENGSRVFPKLY